MTYPIFTHVADLWEISVVELTTEERQMLDGIRLGLAPFPTPNNFAVLWSLVTKGAIPTQQSNEQQQAIFKRMTPELVAFTLRSIAEAIEEVDDIQWQDDVDIIHLRQIADWLENRLQPKETAK